jgi:predicted HNH restriction endonuclease
MQEVTTTWYVKVLTSTDRGGSVKRRSGNSGINVSKYVKDFFPYDIDRATDADPTPDAAIKIHCFDQSWQCRYQMQTRGNVRSGEPRITGDGFGAMIKSNTETGDLILIRCSPPHRLFIFRKGTTQYQESVSRLKWKKGGQSEPEFPHGNTSGLYALPHDNEVYSIDLGKPAEEDVSGDLLDQNDGSNAEGRRVQFRGTRFERNASLRAKCLDHWGHKCRVCGLDFAVRYGPIGKDFIHVHHLNPLSLTGETATDPKKDLCPVCPNCHAMLHKHYPPYSLEDLKRMIDDASGAE